MDQRVPAKFSHSSIAGFACTPFRFLRKERWAFSPKTPHHGIQLTARVQDVCRYCFELFVQLLQEARRPEHC